MKKFYNLCDMSGRTSLITGASGNLGKILSNTLAELGSELIIVDQLADDLILLKDSIEHKWDVPCSIFECDLEEESSRLELIDYVAKKKNSLNCLVNNAAFVGTSNLSGWNGELADQKLDTWRRALEVNLTAPFHLAQGLHKCLRDSKGANIINIGSIYGEIAPDWNLYKGTSMSNPAAYGASKAGLLQLTRWLSSYFGKSIRVNAISPGGIFRDQDKKFVEKYIQKTAIGRMAAEDDFIGIVGYLASDLSQYLTGKVIQLDGGWQR